MSRFASRTSFALFVTVGLAALTAGTAHADPQHYLYVGDLKTGTLLRYDATLGATFGTPYGLGGNTTNPGYITGYGVTEGVHGTANTLLTVAGSGKRLARFNRTTGTFINYVSSMTFSGIGDIAITQDAKTIYVPDEAGNKLYKVDTATGNILASIDQTGVHDVVLDASGNVYASGYNSGLGVIRYDANLGNKTQFIAQNDNGLDHATGMVFGPDGSLYVVRNQYNNPGYVYHYAANGTFLNKVQGSGNDLVFPIGIDYGPDGNLYVASIGNYNNFGHADEITRINLTGGLNPTSAVTPFITYPGTVNTGTYSNTQTNLIWPKYLKFDTNFVPGIDPGGAVPEPSEIAFAGIFGLGMVGLLVRARRRSGNAVQS